MICPYCHEPADDYKAMGRHIEHEHGPKPTKPDIFEDFWPEQPVTIQGMNEHEFITALQAYEKDHGLGIMRYGDNVTFVQYHLRELLDLTAGKWSDTRAKAYFNENFKKKRDKAA